MENKYFLNGSLELLGHQLQKLAGFATSLNSRCINTYLPEILLKILYAHLTGCIHLYFQHSWKVEAGG